MKKLICTALLTLSSFSIADFTVEHSIPSPGETLTESPKTLHMHFTRDVKLLALTVVNSQDQSVDIDFDGTGMQTKFELPFHTLTPETYTVNWSGEDADGVLNQGEFWFTVN